MIYIYIYIGKQTKVINTVPILAVLAGMYCTGMYTGIETSMFCIGLNTDRTGQFWAIPAGTKRTGRYKKKVLLLLLLFFLSFVIFEFLLG